MAVPTEKTPGVYVQEFECIPELRRRGTDGGACVALGAHGHSEKRKHRPHEDANPNHVDGRISRHLRGTVPPGPPLAVGFPRHQQGRTDGDEPILLYQSLQLF